MLLCKHVGVGRLVCVALGRYAPSVGYTETLLPTPLIAVQGIYFAAKSGRMCAEAIVEGSENGTRMIDEADLRVYLDKWDRKYWATYKVMNLRMQVPKLETFEVCSCTSRSCCCQCVIIMMVPSSQIGFSFLKFKMVAPGTPLPCPSAVQSESACSQNK